MRDQLLGGRYRLVRELGEGGMGQVWEAQDETLGRPVAVKVISLLAGGGSRGDEARARFLREARITARLQHPNIVTIHDLGETGTEGNRAPFLVMELVRGEGLDAMLRRGAVTLPDAARWGKQICDALADAHGAGIMHRDIKPSNILITPSGIVKVLDFGVARAADPYATADRLTQTGFIVGTPPYMAPEQARGFPEPRSDLYALGCLLFELITGRLPFQAPDTVGYLTAHLTQAPPAPSSVSMGIPSAWDELVLALLDKDPDQRYPNAADLAQALRQLDHAPEPAPSTGEPAPPPTVPATTPPRVVHGDAPRRIALAMRALLAKRTAETVTHQATLLDHLRKVAPPPSPPPAVAAQKTEPWVRAVPSPPRPAPEGPGGGAQWARFGPPAAVFVLVCVSSDFWSTNIEAYGFNSAGAFSVWLVRFLVVGLLVFTAALTPQSKAATRGAGYVFAFFNAVGFVLGVTLGPGPTLAHDISLYCTAIFLSVAAYCYREIKTRRARSAHRRS
ncbi:MULTISPECIES: serine/threonine-protein kinase [unclassified Streptomyces]|uniref:serine/threonine-protein kinase n=1 Tax=unclassified Streptomyces TaxID=2593676 RepID=UPI00336AA83E